ncbi:hypothetical protein BaRGS_00000546 [Batillaria attramentaria]|uniref:Uncharacterized protein n=1 Tax=Batillaria attramentaria TaxID=370345 RepID=A0ABD0M989_9CAEN
MAQVPESVSCGTEQASGESVSSLADSESDGPGTSAEPNGVRTAPQDDPSTSAVEHRVTPLPPDDHGDSGASTSTTPSRSSGKSVFYPTFGRPPPPRPIRLPSLDRGYSTDNPGLSSDEESHQEERKTCDGTVCPCHEDDSKCPEYQLSPNDEGQIDPDVLIARLMELNLKDTVENRTVPEVGLFISDNGFYDFFRNPCALGQSDGWPLADNKRTQRTFEESNLNSPLTPPAQTVQSSPWTEKSQSLESLAVATLNEENNNGPHSRNDGTLPSIASYYKWLLSKYPDEDGPMRDELRRWTNENIRARCPATRPPKATVDSDVVSNLETLSDVGDGLVSGIRETMLRLGSLPDDQNAVGESSSTGRSSFSVGSGDRSSAAMHPNSTTTTAEVSNTTAAYASHVSLKTILMEITDAQLDESRAGLLVSSFEGGFYDLQRFASRYGLVPGPPPAWSTVDDTYRYAFDLHDNLRTGESEQPPAQERTTIAVHSQDKTAGCENTLTTPATGTFSEDEKMPEGFTADVNVSAPPCPFDVDTLSVLPDFRQVDVQVMQEPYSRFMKASDDDTSTLTRNQPDMGAAVYRHVLAVMEARQEACARSRFFTSWKKEAVPEFAPMFLAPATSWTITVPSGKQGAKNSSVSCLV